MDVKTCNKCGIEKNLDKFGILVKKNGSKYYRNQCKECVYKFTNEHRKSKNKSDNSKYTTKLENNNLTENPIEKETNIMNSFSDKEIKILKEIILTWGKQTPQAVNSKLKENRVKTTYNINQELKQTIDSFANTNEIGLNKSDIVNIALDEYIKKYAHKNKV